jgi:hypothetical protein
MLFAYCRNLSAHSGVSDDSRLVYSHAFSREDWQQGKLEIIQDLTVSEDNLECIVRFGDTGHGVASPGHLLAQPSTDPDLRRDHPQDVSAPLHGHLRRVQAAVVLKNSSKPIQNTVLRGTGQLAG